MERKRAVHKSRSWMGPLAVSLAAGFSDSFLTGSAGVSKLSTSTEA